MIQNSQWIRKIYIEAICETMYDESNEWYEDIYDMSPYDIAELFEKAVKRRSRNNCYI